MVPTLEPGSIFAGDYRIIRKLNSGGMGDIYLVEQLSVNSTRALKLMKPQLLRDPDLRRRFEQEARICARIASEHIVQVVAAGVDEASEMPWIAMEYLEGDSLSTVLAQRGALDPAQVREILRQLCHAVGAAHAAGVVHRDLKPENIMLTPSRRSDVPLTVKVLDFGISKIMSQSNTMGTTTIGTPQWMAPEQTTSDTIGPAADVWPIGLLAFRMLTGKLYWQHANTKAPSLVTLMREVVLEPLEPASQRARQLGSEQLLPPGFDAWFSRCVVREAAARFPDAKVAFTAFEVSVIGQLPLPAVTPLPRRQSLHWQFGAAAAFATVLLGATVLMKMHPHSPGPSTSAPPPASVRPPEHLPGHLNPLDQRQHQLELCKNFPATVGMAEQLESCRQLCFEGAHYESCIQLGALHGVRNPSAAIQAYRKGCDGQNQKACVKLVELYTSGAGELPPNKPAALALNKQLCEQQHLLDGCLAAGRALAGKTPGATVSASGARAMFKLACDLSQKQNKEACEASKITITDRCRQGDLSSCMAACKKGNPDSCVGALANACNTFNDGDLCLVAGMMLIAGPQVIPGLRSDLPRAKKVLQSGCNKGHSQSCTLLGQVNMHLGASR